jgi:hypothetical protein
MNTTAGNHQWRIVVRHSGMIPTTQCCPSVMGLLSLTSHSHTHLEYVMRHIAIKTVAGRSWGRVSYLDILSSHSIMRPGSTLPMPCTITHRVDIKLAPNVLKFQMYRGADNSLARPGRKTSYSDRRFWFSYILFIIIIGGTLVLFICVYIYIYI